MSKETISLDTPHGHRVEARVDDRNFQVEMARVIDPATGRGVVLSQDTMNNIAELVRNNLRHVQAINEMGRVFSQMPEALRELANNKPEHPGVAPYFQNEIGPHAEVVALTAQHVEQLRLRIGTEADHQVEKPHHGLNVTIPRNNGGSREV